MSQVQDRTTNFVIKKLEKILPFNLIITIIAIELLSTMSKASSFKSQYWHRQMVFSINISLTSAITGYISLISANIIGLRLYQILQNPIWYCRY